KQISVLIAFVQGFLNARSDEVGSSFAARRWHRLSFLLAFGIACLSGCLLRKGAYPFGNALRCS
ncbi:MAG: hypothetical protein JXR54_11180, partial [Tannerellaceae bacterium]|nr:hypothetical protein [Tannerellaceae bacterium]